MEAQPFGNTGYLPPINPDKRNFSLESAQAIAPFPANFQTDISNIPVFNQYKIPDCVENAVTFIRMAHQFKKDGKLTTLSRRFLAIETVKRDGFPLDQGTSIENALYVSHDEGICEGVLLSDNHELDIHTFVNPGLITQGTKDNAARYKTKSYAFLTDKSINGLKNAIFQNGLVLVGGTIDENWWTAPNGQVSWSKKDIYPIRPPKSLNPGMNPSLSRHAFVLYGYDEGGFFLHNSFGPQWADNGNNYIPNAAMGIIYEAATIVDLTDDQVSALKNIQTDLQQTTDIIHNLDPQNPQTPQIVLLLNQVGGLIAKMFSAIFQTK